MPATRTDYEDKPILFDSMLQEFSDERLWITNFRPSNQRQKPKNQSESSFKVTEVGASSSLNLYDIKSDSYSQKEHWPLGLEITLHSLNSSHSSSEQMSEPIIWKDEDEVEGEEMTSLCPSVPVE